MNAVAMVQRCRLHQGAPDVDATPCHWCREPSTEVAEGRPACYLCAQTLAVARLRTGR